MKLKKIALVSTLVIILALISIPFLLYMSLNVYKWEGTYLVNTETGLKYHSKLELNGLTALDKIKPVEVIGRINENRLLFRTWVKRIEGIDENKMIYLQGLMYFEVLEAVGDNDYPKGFDFILKYGVGAKNVIDTYKDTFQKDLINAGTAKTSLSFTAEEMKRIYEKMQTIDIFSYPTNYAPPYEDNARLGMIRVVEPHMTYDLRLNIDGSIKEISWNDTNMSESAKAKELRGLFSYIDELIREKEEYKKLPEAVGGYD